MRRHALVLLIVVSLVVPADFATGGATTLDAAATRQAASTPEPAAQILDAPLQAAPLQADSPTDTDAQFQPGQALVRRGDYAQAEQFYADLATQDPNAAPRALLLEARATLADGDPDGAEALVQQLLSDYPDSDQTANAYFALEQIRRAAGNCTAALRALDAYEAAAGRDAIGPYAELQRAQCAGQLGQWSTELTAATTALSIEGGGPRLTQIEALERAAEADLMLGQPQQALDLYTRSLGLAGTPAYTAEMLYTTGTIARALGQTTLAADRFRAIVVEFPDQARGPYALDQLVDMGLDATVSPLQAGMVRFDAQSYAAAVAQFDQVDPSSPDWGNAQISRADAEVKLGNEERARTGLESVVDAGVREAGSAYQRLGQLDERDGDESSAEAEYQQMALAAPDRTAEALFHVGFTRFLRGDSQGALSAWQTGIGSGPPAPDLLAQLEYWIGRVQPDGSAEAQDAFNHAAAASPESYYGLRAQDQIDGNLSVASVPSSASWLTATDAEVRERAAWFAALNLTPDGVSQDVNALPAMQRAGTLLDLGLRTEATWEIDGVVAQYAATSDVAHMSAVADWTTAHDMPQQTMRIGQQMQQLVGLGGLPRAMQKQVYPAGWGDIVAQLASANGVDPLLMLAVMRQESAFDPHAQSGAQARGLTQIVPSTAQDIADKLGNHGFVLNDLFKPAVSVQFGTYLLAELLGQYHGQVFPTLAAYDAGGGNVSSWIQRYGADPDLLVEQIPFAETQNYLRVVYENYWHYRNLYAP